jgi:hypothetical protein
MTAAISITHAPLDGDAPELVNIAYRIDVDGDVRIIACEVSTADRYAHRWLAVRKFDMRMRLLRGKYTQLHTAKNDSVNRDTAQFIDEVWAGVMEKEGWAYAV